MNFMGKLIVITGLDGSSTSTVGDQLHMEEVKIVNCLDFRYRGIITAKGVEQR